MFIYIYSGDGLALGSTIVVYSKSCSKVRALKTARIKAEQEGLNPDSLELTQELELDPNKGQVIYFNNGDY